MFYRIIMKKKIVGNKIKIVEGYSVFKGIEKNIKVYKSILYNIFGKIFGSYFVNIFIF